MAGRRRRGLLLVKIAVVAGAFLYLSRSGQLDPDTIHLVSRGWLYAGAGLLAIGAGVCISFVRWHVLLRGAGLGFGLRETFRLGAVGVFFNTFLLGGLGGDAVKVAMVVRLTRDRHDAVVSVLVDRLCGLFGLLLFGGVAAGLEWPTLASGPARIVALAALSLLGMAAFGLCAAGVALLGGRRQAVWLVAVAAALAAGWAAVGPRGSDAVGAVVMVLFAGLGGALGARTLANERAAAWLRTMPLGGGLVRTRDAVLAYRDRPLVLLSTVGMGVLTQACMLLAIWLATRATGVPAVSGQVLLAAPLALLANVLPLPAGGLGAGEVAYAEILGLLPGPSGAAVEGGALAFLFFRFLLVAMQFCIGLPAYLATGQQREVAAPAGDGEADQPESEA